MLGSPLQTIKEALTGFDPTALRASSLTLLKALGYSSNKTLEIPGSDPKEFIKKFAQSSSSRFNEDEAVFEDWKQADFLFQLTDEDLSYGNATSQSEKFDKGLYESYVFWAIELKGSLYSRTELAGVTRQINRLFPMPAVVFISYDSKLSIAVINRRHNKVNRDRDVLEKVSLIWEIDTKKPYRAHLDILESLSWQSLAHWIDSNNRLRNFDSLLSGHLAALDTEGLNKKLYEELEELREFNKRRYEEELDMEEENVKIKEGVITRNEKPWLMTPIRTDAPNEKPTGDGLSIYSVSLGTDAPNEKLTESDFEVIFLISRSR